MSPQRGPGGSGPQSMDTLNPGDMYDQDRYAPRPSSRSSFFGMDPPSNGGSTGPSTTQAEQIAAYHRGGPGPMPPAPPQREGPNDPHKGYRQSAAAAPLLAHGITGPAPQAVSPIATSPTAGSNGPAGSGSFGLPSNPSSVGGPGGAGPSAAERGMGGLGPSGSTRPPSIAPTVTSSYGGTVGSIYGAGMLLDHRHLQPGKQAALLSHEKTLELYRHNAKKTNDPTLIFEFAVFMIDAAKSMAANEAENNGGGVAGKDGGLAVGLGGAGSQTNSRSASPVATGAREELVKEAIGLLKRIADRGHADAQYFLADCYANGIGTPKGKNDFDRAYPLFVLAAKHGHADAAYRAGTCYEKGWGCRKDAGKALQFYRKAASPGDAGGHPGAMYRLATAELNGELGCKKSAKEGVKWLKRSAEAATPEFPHALHELALLHERGIDNVLFVDPEYSCELLAQAAELGYAPSAYKLGVNYEYGRMGCPQDAGLSIHMYNIAAQQGHKEACFALTAWYLVGAPGILPQSDTEAYLWAKKAAEQGLGKAEYAVGYFTEMGIGTVKDLAEAKAWYKRAQEHGDKRANQRLAALGSSNGVGLGFGMRKGGNGPAPPLKAGTHAQGYSNAAQQGERQRVLREQQQQQQQELGMGMGSGAEDARLAGMRDDARSAKERERSRSQQARNKRRFDFVAPPEDMRVSQYILPDAEKRAAAAAAVAVAAGNNRQSVAPSERPMSQMPSMQEMRQSGYGNNFGGMGAPPQGPGNGRKYSNGPGPGAGPGAGPSPAFYPGGPQGPPGQQRPPLPPGAGPPFGQGGAAYPTYEPGQSILKKNPSSPPPSMGPPGGAGAGRWPLDTQMAASGRAVSGPQSAGMMSPGSMYGAPPPPPPPGVGGYRPAPQLPPGAGAGAPPNGRADARLPGAALPPPPPPPDAGKKGGGWFSKS
ncbi:Chitin synthase 4 [Tilletia horrida]|nr:Chitin synthase 4 [Tilletia horrida]